MTGNSETVKTFALEKTWSEDAIDSATFKSAGAPSNPALPFKSDSFPVGGATVGGFALAGSDISYLGDETPVALTSDSWTAFKKGYAGDKPVWLRDNRFHVGMVYGSPAIGDLRVTYSKGNADDISVAGKQTAAKLGPWRTSNGRDVFLVRAGIYPAARMFDDAIASNTMLTWVTRALGLLAMFIGFKLAFSILTAIGDAIPLVGNLVRAGTSLVAFALTMLVGSIVIGLGWIVYRPLLGIGILAVGVIVALAVAFIGRGKNAAQPATARA